MYDLKTISGKASLDNRLMESTNQTNRVLINVSTDYNPRLMSIQIKKYFDANPSAVEVLIYKGKKTISVSRRFTENALYLFMFRQKYMK